MQCINLDWILVKKKFLEVAGKLKMDCILDSIELLTFIGIKMVLWFYRRIYNSKEVHAYMFRREVSLGLQHTFK